MANLQDYIQTFESDGSNITLNESILSEIQSIRVRGNTVRSLTASTYSTLCLDDKTRESVEPINSSTDSISGFSVSTSVDTTGGWMYVMVGTDIESMLEPSTSYDIYLEIESTYAGSTEVLLSSDNWEYIPTDVATINFTEGKAVYKVTLTTKEDIFTNQTKTMAQCSFNNRKLSTGDEITVKLVNISKSGTYSNSLLSTTLVLTHNGTQYPVEEVIDGQVVLRGVGDVYDEWERLSDGTSKLTARLWSKTITDTFIDSIVLRNTGDGSTTIAFNVTEDAYIIKKDTNGSLLCNMFDKDVSSQNGIEGCGVSSNSNEIYVEISRSKLESNDLAGVKKYLKSLHDAGTPLEFVYELQTPIVTTLPASRTPQIFTTMGTNTIGVVSAVKPRYISISAYNSAETITDCKTYDGVDGKITLGDSTLPYATLRSLEVKGQTVKNYCNTILGSNVIDSSIVDDASNLIKIDHVLGTTSIAEIKTSNILKPSTEYDIVVFVKQDTNKLLYIYGDTGTAFKFTREKVNITNGKAVISKTTIPDFTNVTRDIKFAVLNTDESTHIEFTVVIVDKGIGNKITSYIPFGLSSTQAILTHNGANYPFYLNAEDKTNGKVLDLGGIEGARNTISILEDGSAVYVQNVIEIMFDGDESVSLRDAKTNTIRFGLAVNNSLLVNENNITTICNRLKSISFKSIFNEDIEGVSQSTSISEVVVRVDKSKLTTQDVAGFKAWLQANPVTVRYQLATPITTIIPKELVPTFLLENGANEIQLNSSVAPTSLKATVQTFKELDIPKVQVYKDNVESMTTKLGTHVDATKQVYNELQATEQKLSLLEETTIEGHISDTTNPHHVTKTQVGLGNVPNYPVATTTEAEQGLTNEKLMTPKLVKEAIRALGGDGSSSGAPVFTTNFATYKFTCGTSPTSTFTIPDFKGKKILAGIVFDNYLLTEDNEYVVSTEGVVQLNFELQPQTNDKHAEFVTCLLFNIGYHYNELSGIPSTFTPSEHKHTASQITGLPTSLPANGGNADTVDGKHASDFLATTGGTVNGSVSVTGGVTVSQSLSARGLQLTDYGTPLEVGKYIDFHDVGSSNSDYDGRLYVHGAHLAYANGTGVTMVITDEINNLNSKVSAMEKKLGGDYMGKDIVLLIKQDLSKNVPLTYTNSKGGILRVATPNTGVVVTITVDGSVISSGRSFSDISNIISYADGYYGHELIIPFNSSVSLTPTSGGIAFYPVAYVNK